jgi:diketogulonate reductase-like aldo/keto reductase
MTLSRRQCLVAGAGAIGAVGAAVLARPARAVPAVPLLERPVPSDGTRLPAVGLGTWITFNVGRDSVLRAQAVAVMRAFFAGGGRVIDSSPMYGSAQAVVGDGLAELGMQQQVYAAEKVWTGSGAGGAAQIEATRALWRLPRLDLVQVHNLLAWEAHLETLAQMKAEGRVRHIGLTTSHGRRHAELEQVMRSRAIDVVQLTYNPVDTVAEKRLLPLARERGIAVLVNRPFQGGALLERLAREPLPGWIAELGCDGWAQAVLKFVLAHPAVSCVIPATTRVAHVRQNLGVMTGPLPDAALARRIGAHIRAL